MKYIVTEKQGTRLIGRYGIEAKSIGVAAQIMRTHCDHARKLELHGSAVEAWKSYIGRAQDFKMLTEKALDNDAQK